MQRETVPSRVPYLPYVFGKQDYAKPVHPDHMLQNVVSDLVLHCLLPIQQFIDTSRATFMGLFNF